MAGGALSATPVGVALLAFGGPESVADVGRFIVAMTGAPPRPEVLAAVVRMGLAALDQAGIVKTAPEDRGIDVNWPTALPESDMDRLAEAQVKLTLGVPREVVLKELGYGELVAEKQINPAPAADAATAAKAAADGGGAGPG